MSQQDQSTPPPAPAPATLFVTTFADLQSGVRHAGPIGWEVLYEQWRRRKALPADAAKSGQPLLAPAEFTGNRAKSDAVVKVHAQVIEFDNCSKARHADGTSASVPLPPERRCTFDQGVALVREKGWDAIVVTSYSHAPEHHKFRIYLRLSRPVTPPEHRRLQRWLHALFDAAGMLPDPATIDPGRRWFIPIRREAHEYRVERVEGRALDVDALLPTLPIEVEPTRARGKVETRLDEFIERLRDRVNMIELLEAEGERVERRGHYARLWRPFGADGHSPGCVAYADHYFDHGTREYVDAISYIEKKKSLNFWGALDWLADRAGIPHFDRLKATRCALVDPTAAIERLPETLPETGREDILAEVIAAIATLDDADRPQWIARVVDHFRREIALPVVDPQPLYDALPDSVEPKDAEGLVAPVIAAIATLTPTEQADWLTRLARRWMDGRRCLLDRARLGQLVRVSHKAQVAALRSTTVGDIDRRTIERLVRDRAKLQNRRADEPDATTEYGLTDGCLHLVRVAADGTEIAVKLMNGDLTITECVTRDDGMQTTEVFVIRATLADGTVIEPIDVPTDSFDTCEWITPATAGAIRVEPSVRDARRYIAHAVLTRSTYERTRSFAAFGWHEIHGKQVFVHAGGVIGTSEPIDVRVAHPKLAAFTLPDVVPDPNEVEQVGYDKARRLVISRAVERTFRLLTVATDKVAAPLFASTVSAPLMPVLPVRVPVLILGTTGTKKSSLAREYQRLYGRFLTDADFPLNFESTSTATSYLGYVPQHLLAVADDAYPKGSSREAERQRSHIRSLIHNYVNGQSRERATKDGGLATSRPIRCLLWLTAETDVIPPQVAESTAFRALKIKLRPGDVSDGLLSEIQAVPDLTVATRAYLEHLVADTSWRQTVPARFAAVVAELRADRARLGLQDRQPEIVAALVVGFETWMRWAAGYLADFDDRKVAQIVRIVRKAIVAVAVEQTAQAANVNPANSYLATLKALLISGRCRVVERNAALNGAAPAPEIGWYDTDYVIFEQQSAYREVGRFADHDLLPWPDLYDRLVQAALCEPPTVDEKTKVRRGGTRVRAGGTRGYFLAFKREVFADIPLSADDIDEETRREGVERQRLLSLQNDEIASVAFSALSPGGDA